MLAWLTENAATVIISAVLLVIVGAIIRGMVRGKVGGCSCGECGGECAACRGGAQDEGHTGCPRCK